MKIEMFDDKTGLPVGPIEIPDDMVVLARRLESWMEQNAVDALCGLRLDTKTKKQIR